MARKVELWFWLVLVAVPIGYFDAANSFAVERETAQSTSAIHLFNARRTGYTPQDFAPPYHLAWTHKARHKPRPAWREPAWEVQRIDLDYAYAISAGQGLVYVASSSDHAVHALDLDSGELQWRFFTEGPVRLAPAVSGGKVYASSDDGAVYCLEGSTGRLIWKHRPDIPDERLIGNEQMVSRWPARSGVLVDDGRAYTTFGMWSPEGIVVTCLDAQTGVVLWRNDSSGTKYSTQPHYEAMGGVSPQGYLALCGEVLVVPCGRATPAFFDRGTGELLYSESEGLFPGGAWTMTYDDLAFTPCEYLKKPNPERPDKAEADIWNEATMVGIRAQDGQEVFHLNGVLKGVIDDKGRMSLIGPGKLVSIDLKDVLKAAPDSYVEKMGSSEGHMVDAAQHKRWETPVKRLYELIQAGSTLIAGERGTLACYNAEDGNKTWETELAGDVRELLIVGQSLLVSTTEGEIHCFRADKGNASRGIGPVSLVDAVPPATTKRVNAALSDAGVSDGYGLVLGNANDACLTELASQSNVTWHWAAGTRDVATIRERLADAGLYGPRIAIHNVGANPLPYADYSANLIVFNLESVAELDQTSASEVYRVLRPYGGVAVIASPESLRPEVDRWLTAGGIPEAERRPVDAGVRIERGPLPGAGAWTHQYADAGKSGASADELVRLPLKVLWFGSVGPADIVSRHYRAPVPLAIDGYLYVAGIDYLHAIDAYSGRILWERKLPGVGRWPSAYRGGCMAADENSVYALQGTTCLRLDRDTGKTLFTYKPPKAPGRKANAQREKDDELIWEYLAVTGDAVVGTLGQPNVRRSWWSMAHPANRLLFVLDKATGKLRWSYQSQSAIDSNAIAIEGDWLCLIDGLAPVDVFARARRGVPAKTKGKPKKPPKSIFSLPGSPHPRVLKALALQSGKQLWDTSEIGDRQNSLYAANGVILTSIPIWHGLNAKSVGPGLSAFSADDGRVLWTRDAKAPYPVIVGDAVYLPEACDLRTGELIQREDPLTGQMAPFSVSVTGGCGRMAGCANAIMKRSGSMGLFDLSGRSGVYHYPNVRASCWINMIPACGLVLAPEGSSSCPCSYNYKTSMALMPATRHNHWGLYTGSPRPKTQRVTQLRLNFGAPGDKPDKEGNIWFAYPRPSTTGPRGAGGMGRVPFDSLPIEAPDIGTGVTPIWRNPDWTTIEGTDKPWLYASALTGPVKLQIRLALENSPSREYHVTLFFHNFNDTADPATFDVRLQGETALSPLPARGERVRGNKNGEVVSVIFPSQEPGKPISPFIKELTIKAADQLVLELLPRDGGTPRISGMEIEEVERQKT